MRKLKLAPYFIVLAASAIWAQQAPAPKPNQPTPPPIVRNPHSTEADLAVPLCATTFDDSLERDGIAGINDKNVKPPISKSHPEPKLTDEVLHQGKGKNRISGIVVSVGLVVDANGKPQEVCLKQSAGYGLDANTAKAVSQYYFQPATKDGNPVAKRISIMVVFNSD